MKSRPCLLVSAGGSDDLEARFCPPPLNPPFKLPLPAGPLIMRPHDRGGLGQNGGYSTNNMGAVWVGTPYGAFPKVFINTRSLGTKTLPHCAFHFF